jgi:plasmid maintenance system antidote protein VapI
MRNEDYNDAEKILSEDHMSIKEMAESLGCSDAKIRNLIERGACAIDGRVVRLGVAWTESGRRSSLEAYRRFQLELNTIKESADEQQTEQSK